MTLFAVACAAIYPAACRTSLAGLLAVPLSQHHGDLASISQSADLGCLRSLHLCDGLLALLVCRIDSRPGNIAGPSSETCSGQIIYGMLAMGWRGAARHWHRYETAYLLLAGLATPLVVSVHTMVSFDFAVAIIPGWHATIFPPYFVAGAIFSGFAMVMTLAIPIAHYLPVGGFHHHAAPRKYGEDDAGNRIDCVIRLHDGSFHGLV